MSLSFHSPTRFVIFFPSPLQHLLFNLIHHDNVSLCHIITFTLTTSAILSHSPWHLPYYYIHLDNACCFISFTLTTSAILSHSPWQRLLFYLIHPDDVFQLTAFTLTTSAILSPLPWQRLPFYLLHLNACHFVSLIHLLTYELFVNCHNEFHRLIPWKSLSSCPLTLTKSLILTPAPYLDKVCHFVPFTWTRSAILFTLTPYSITKNNGFIVKDAQVTKKKKEVKLDRDRISNGKHPDSLQSYNALSLTM